jgi:hypothetical protein
MHRCEIARNRHASIAARVARSSLELVAFAAR